MNAPDLDQLISECNGHPLLEDNALIKQLVSVFKNMCRIKQQGDDEARSIWFTVERGKLTDYGNYEEYIEMGEVTNKKEFANLWKEDYPDKEKWYKFGVSKYDGVFYFYIESKLVIQFEENTTNKKAYNYHIELTNWLTKFMTEKITSIEQNLIAYNKNVNQNLPFSKRVGRILRSDFWSVFPENKKDIEGFLSSEKIETLTAIKRQAATNSINKLNKMNASDFFHFCEIGYDANKYFEKSEEALIPKQKYNAFADGRDCGLKSIDENSYTAFEKWYHNEMNCGGHPWEICRGGNSTHISLFIVKDNQGWYVRLQGSSRERVVETVIMAVAFYKQKIPFELSDADEIYKMITGTDFIGIVPKGVFPRYCHSYFPHEDEIIDFMNLFDKSDEIAAKAYWYPLDEIALSK